MDRRVARLVSTARNFLTRPTHWHADERATSPGEGLQIFSPLSEEPPDFPSLRASDEHRFIVRVLRARRMVWRLPIPPF